MRIGRRKLADSIRIATLISTCVALVAMTSGLLLAIHLYNHAGHHDSHACPICQQLVIAPQKATLAPGVAITHDTREFRVDVLGFNEHTETCHLQISRPRGPPC